MKIDKNKGIWTYEEVLSLLKELGISITDDVDVKKIQEKNKKKGNKNGK